MSLGVVDVVKTPSTTTDFRGRSPDCASKNPACAAECDLDHSVCKLASSFYLFLSAEQHSRAKRTYQEDKKHTPSRNRGLLHSLTFQNKVCTAASDVFRKIRENTPTPPAADLLAIRLFTLSAKARSTSSILASRSFNDFRATSKSSLAAVKASSCDAAAALAEESALATACATPPAASVLVSSKAAFGGDCDCSAIVI